MCIDHNTKDDLNITIELAIEQASSSNQPKDVIIPLGRFERNLHDRVYSVENMDMVLNAYDIMHYGFMAVATKTATMVDTNKTLETNIVSLKNEKTNLVMELERAGNRMIVTDGALTRIDKEHHDEMKLIDNQHKTTIKRLKSAHSKELAELTKRVGDNTILKSQVTSLKSELNIKENIIATLKSDIDKLQRKLDKELHPTPTAVLNKTGRLTTKILKDNIKDWARDRLAGMTYAAIAVKYNTNKSTVLRTLTGQTRKDCYPAIKRILDGDTK